MVYKEHIIELFVNGQRLELESQNSLNLRFQNVLYSPEKISSSQAEYSFEISIPSTPANDKVFDYANNLSKLNKFNKRWDAEVYGDGTLIFSGSLTLNGFKEKQYKCNLVSVKVYSLEDIFGDDTLSDIDWEIPFDGAGVSGYTINYYNENSNEVMFPLVCYGAFQKSPYREDPIANEYTSKFDLDSYNRWYVESFYPSLNMLQLLKRAFNHKGYVVDGDVFNDVYLNDVYMSTNLADEQSPTYNLGHPKFGKVELTATFNTTGNEYYEQDLKFPYYRVYDFQNITDDEERPEIYEYNFSSANIFNVLQGSVTSTSSYMYQPNESVIVIPADGFYKIEMDVSSTLQTTGNLRVQQYFYSQVPEKQIRKAYMNVPVGFDDTTPIEIALVKNYDDSYELIKGKRNIIYKNGTPTPYYSIDGVQYNNVIRWETCYPHENPYISELPTEKGTFAISYPSEENNTLGYMYDYNTIMAYDQAVSDSFVCGFSSLSNGVVSVMKNGYGWNPKAAEEQYAFYNQRGYTKKRANGNTTAYTSSNFNKNEYPNAVNSFVSLNSTNTKLDGSVYCMVYLHKNDVLQVLAVQRNYGDVRYETSNTVRLKIEAASPNSYSQLRYSDFGYNSPTEFPVNLKLNNFLNNETKISDWVQGIADAFNLEITQDGKTVSINHKKKFNVALPNAVDIDDRVNTADVESGKIKYPKSMAVRYKIDTEEWGFEKSVNPPEKLNDPDWKDYGDSGYTVINLSDDEFETSKSEKNLNFSYTWYDDFNWYPIPTFPVPLRLPVISKYTYMIDGYDYEESMKHDGYGLSQRFWFKPVNTNAYVYTRTYPSEIVNVYAPSNVIYGNNGDLNLSYKTTEPSLLQYFNITPYLASNYVTVEVYLSPEEYKQIKNGAMVKFDDDLYLVTEINGFDCTGNNPTELKMIKKI